MYSKTLSFAVCMLLSAGVYSQDYTDALRFNSNDLMGTARTQAMAGAFGAVGADLTSMAVNPAGMAVYRATEVGLTLGVSAIKDDSQYWQTKSSDDRVRVPFSQIGAAFSFGRMRENGGGLVASNLFVGYNRVADFSSMQRYNDPYAYNSLLDYFSTDEQRFASMTGDLAGNAGLLFDTDDNSYSYNVWEAFKDGHLDAGFRMDENELGLISISKSVKTEGSKGDIAFGYAANIANKLYVGGSLNIQTLSYTNTTTHYEYFDGVTVAADDPTSFTYQSYLDQDGTGICFNIGAILRPVNFLRVGFALHSPSFFSVSERYWAKIYNPAKDKTFSTSDFEYEYKYRVPSRFIASIAGIIGRGGMISVDYERINHSRSKFTEKGSDDPTSYNTFGSLNNLMKDDIFCASNTLRIGGELSVLNPVYLRAGYRFTTSPLKEAYYFNKPKDYSISGGIGFRKNNFFVDLAYVCSVKKTDQWVLPDTSEGYLYGPGGIAEVNTPALLTQKTHSGVISVGFRF